MPQTHGPCGILMVLGCPCEDTRGRNGEHGGARRPVFHKRLTEVGGRGSEPSPNRQGPLFRGRGLVQLPPSCQIEQTAHIARSHAIINFGIVNMTRSALFSQASFEPSKFPCQPVQPASVRMHKYLM